MDETLQQGVNLTNQQIAEALSYGVPEEDIYNHLRQSAEPHHMEIVRRYDMAKGAEKFNAQPQQQQTSPQSVNTDIVDLMSEHPVATGLLGLGGAALLGTGAYALKTGVVDPWATGRQEAAKLKAQAEAEPSPAIKVQQEQNALAARRLDLEAQQMQNSASIVDNVKPAQEMSPFDAAKLKEQELRNQKLQIAIDNLKAEEARKQAVHEANQAAAQAKKAAQTKQTTGGTITETEAGMLAADQTAKIQKAIDADQKAAAAKAAIPAQTAPAPVAPTPSPTVQLTPSPEVAAEGAPSPEGTKVSPVNPESTTVETPVVKRTEQPWWKQLPPSERYAIGTYLHPKTNEEISRAFAMAIPELSGIKEGQLEFATQGEINPKTGKPMKGGGLVPEHNKLVSAYVANKLGVELTPEGTLPEKTLTHENRLKLQEGFISDIKNHVNSETGKLNKLPAKLMGAAALLGLTEAVQAAQKGDFSPLKEAGFFAAAGAIPVVGQIAQGLSPSQVASGKIPQMEQRERIEKFILNQYNNRRELQQKIEGKNPSEANKIRSEFLQSAPTTDYENAIKIFAQQAANKKGVPPPKR